MTADPVQKFLLKNKRNLRIATTVGEAWLETREQIVADFLKRLETRLKGKLKGWHFEGPKEPFFVARIPCFYFAKTAWSDEYSLALQANKYGKRMEIGVYRDYDTISKRRFSNELLNAIKSVYPTAHPENWWEARVFMQSPAADWRKPDVLWRMNKDSKFLVEVAGQLLEVARLSEPIIDGLVRKYKK